MSTALALSLLLGTAGQYPDDLDVFRTDPKANVLFLLDSSCSMGPSYGTLPTGCNWFAANYNSGSTSLSKNAMMRASLVGCASSTDGILDRWASRLNIAIWHFGNSVGQRAAFGSSLPTLETAVLGVPANGNTPMTQGLRDSGNSIRSAFTDATHPTCRKDYVVMMSDGEPNGGGATFNYECVAPVENVTVSADQPWIGARYLYREAALPVTPRDLLCTVSGTQPIRTYTVGFEALASFDETSLMNIASNGDGAYFHATDIQALSSSFETILSSIVARSRVDFSAATAQTSGIFSSNYVYSAFFKPSSGPWPGNVKKFCVEPRRLSGGRYDTTQTNCMFVSPTGRDLVTNISPQDLWTYSSSANADSGGAGSALFSLLGAGANAAPVAPYWTHRNILTWVSSSGYVAVNPSNISGTQTWANGCDTYRLINYLHGYTWDADCASGNPVQVRSWPLGAAIHSSPVLLKYGACHDAADAAVSNRCFVAQAMNDGMLHFFDAANGRETAAIVPQELWALGSTAKSMLSQMSDQPTAQLVQRYFLDGDVRLFHDDVDGDTVIDPGETARLVFGLGRAGYAYYQIDVRQLTNGLPTTANNPIYPMAATVGTGFEELRETWHAPYMGRALISGARKSIMAFGSGHVAANDDPNAALRTQAAGLRSLSLSNEQNVACAGAGNFAAYNGYASTGATSCSVAYKPGCLGTRASQCYDTGYWSTNPAATLPLTLQFGPFRWHSGGRRAVAYRIHFNHFDLGSSDRLVIKDGAGNVLLTYTGTQLDNGGITSWFWDPLDTGFYLEIQTNGVDSRNVGVEMANIKYMSIPDGSGAAPAAHNPTLYIVDAEKWNGSSPRSFTSPASGAAILRVAKTCPNGDSGTCLNAAAAPALSKLTCPITAEVSAYTEGDLLRALYFATECGEIWKTWTDDAGLTWKVRRLLSLNTADRTGLSKNFRKLFRRLDVVPSGCPGRRVIGLYFGTGDEQRPQATDELTDSGLNSGRDVIGVLWDDGAIDEQSISNLQDVTSAAPGTIDPRTLYGSGKRGWYIQLGTSERMLRNPLVFDGAAFYKTRQPTGGATECAAGSGTDRVYAVNSCDASPLSDTNGDGVTDNSDRERWSGTTDIGSELFLYVPRSGSPIVTAGDSQVAQNARLNRTHPREVARFYMWRRPWRDR